MQGLKRRLTYVVLYEGLALVLLSITFNVMSDEGLAHAGVLGALTVLIAVSWNCIYNLLFEAFLLDAGLTLFFVLFTFLYNWGFDRVFGLPLAAQ